MVGYSDFETISFVTTHLSSLPGIITALREYQTRLVEHNISIFVRRAGPNYQEGLRRMREIGSTLGIPLYVFGPETHMTAICGMALGKKPIPKNTDVHFATANFLLPGGQEQKEARKMATSQTSQVDSPAGKSHHHEAYVFVRIVFLCEAILF